MSRIQPEIFCVHYRFERSAGCYDVLKLTVPTLHREDGGHILYVSIKVIYTMHFCL